MATFQSTSQAPTPRVGQLQTVLPSASGSTAGGTSSSSSSKRNPADYTLQTVFADFIRASEVKVNTALAVGVSGDSPLDHQLKVGVDLSFDRLLTTLGSVAKHRPRHTIDAIMIWRKFKSEPVDGEQLRQLMGTLQSTSAIRTDEAQALFMERKMLASNFILSRVLMEVLQHLDRFSLPADLGEKLEEMVFGQLKNADPESLVGAYNRQLNFDLFAELLGTLSAIRFHTISNRFVKELTETSILVKDTKLELILTGMRFLRLKMYPVDALDETVEFLSELADLYKKTHSALLKHAYTNILHELLQPLAEMATAEVNIPSWMKAIEVIYTKATKMSAKPRHLLVVTPLIASCLCVSKRDFFLGKWSPMVEQCVQRFKDRTLRAVSLNAISRLLWVYLYRCNESITATYKKLDVIVKALFPPGRRSLNPLETPAEYFVEITYCIAARFPDYGIKNILYVLLGIDTTISSVDYIATERTIIGLRLLLLMLNGGGKEDVRPPFPQSNRILPSGSTTGVDSTAMPPLPELPIANVKLREVLDRVNAHLGTTIKLLHQAFGGYLLTDDRFVRSVSATAYGTMSSGTVGSSADFAATVLTKEKQPYYDLLRTWVSALPVFMPSGLEEREVFDLVCKYTAHVDPELNAVAVEALIRLCKSYPEKQINLLRSFGQFLLSLPDRASELAEKSLKLFIELLGYWMKDVARVFALNDGEGSVPSRTTRLSRVDAMQAQAQHNHDPVLLWGKMQELETIGLLYLCSALPAVRGHAITLLTVAADLFERFLRKEEGSTGNYIIKVLRSFDVTLVDRFRNDYGMGTVVEQMAEKKFDEGFLLDVARSDAPAENRFWVQSFSLVIKRSFEKCPTVVHTCSEHVCQRLNFMQSSIAAAADPARFQNATLTSKFYKTTAAATDDVIDQWKFYLMYAFATETTSEPAAKKGFFKRSAPSPKLTNRATTAQELFRQALPLLSTERTAIRGAVVLALGHTNWAVFKDLIDEVQPHIKTIIEDMRARYMRGVQKRNKKLEHLRAEITHVFLLAAEHVLNEEYLRDDTLISFMLNYIRELGAFLSDADVQLEWDHQSLRYYFCGLVERLHDNLAKQCRSPDDWVPYDLRYSLFKLMEEWCGHGQRGHLMREREEKMALSVLEQLKDTEERTALTLAMDDQRRALEYASLRAMAVLCQGQLVPANGVKFGASFNLSSLFQWIDAVFQSTDPRLQPIARLALESMLLFNQRDAALWADVISFCYQGHGTVETKHGYFQSLVKILTDVDFQCDPSMILNLILFKLGDTHRDIRQSAAKLLKVVGTRLLRSPFRNDFEVAIMSPSAATYKQGRNLIAAQLANDFAPIHHQFLSEATLRLVAVNKEGKQRILANILPWIDKLRLDVSTQNVQDHNLVRLHLNNFMYLTLQFGDELEREIEALWFRLVANVKNTRPLVQYLLQLCLERKDVQLPAFCNRVIVYVGRTSAFDKLVELLMGEVTPKSLIVQKNALTQYESVQCDIHIPGFFTAPLDKLLSDPARKVNYSRGQLVTVFIVDFAIEKGKYLADHLPLLLHLVAVQVDQTSSPVRDHGRHLLIGLLHAFGERAAQGDKDVAKQLIGYLSDKSNDFVDQAVVTGDRQRRSLTMSKSLETLLRDTVAYFESVVPNLRQVWGELAIGWATSCPVRHVAVRSLQTFGILQPTFTQKMLSEILVRLSNIVADPNEEVQGFVLEILGMLDVITNGLESRQLAEIPQLFWAVHICLFTCNEQEYGVLLRIMKTLLMRLDMNDTTVDDVLCECIGRISDVPIPSLLLSIGRGLHSQSCAKLAFECWTILLDRHSKVLDQSPERWLFTMLYAVIPLAHAFCGEETMHTEAARFAGKLTVKLAESKLPDFARLFDSYSRGRIRAKDDLLKAFSLLVIDEFLKDHAARILGCTMGFLRNSDFQSETMELMRLLLVNARKEQLQAVLLNADLLRNLYQAFGSSAHFEEGLHVLHELMRVFTDTQESKVLMGSRAIQKLAREGGPPASFVQYTRWPYSETEMKQTRGFLSRLAAAYFVGRAAEQPTSADAAGDSSDSVVVKTGVGASGGWTADDDVAPAMELASEEEEAAFEQAPVLIDEDSADVDGGGPRPRSSTIIIDNYDELVNQLESLEDFFQVEGLHEEAGHGDFDDVVPKSSAETMNDSLYDDVGLMAGGTGAHAQLPLVVEPTYAENNSYDSDRYSSEGESDNVPSNSGDDYSDDNEDTFALESFLDKRLSTMTPENVRATAPDRAVLQISTPPRRLAEILEISQSPTTGKRSPTASDIEALSPRIVSSAASTKSPRVAESSIGQTVVMEQRPAAPLSAASETRGITPAIRSPSRPGSASPSSPRKVRFATQRDTLTALFDLPEVQNWDPCNQTTTDIAFIAATSHQSYNIYHGIFRHLLQLLRQHLLDTSGAADIEVCQMVLHVTKELRVSYESEPRVHFADANGEEIAEFTRKVMVIKEQHPKEYRSLVDDYHRLLRTFEERLLQCGELRQRVMKHDREVVAMYGRDASPVRSEQEKRREHQKFCVDLYELALSLLGVAGAVLDIQEMIDFVVMERANADTLRLKNQVSTLKSTLQIDLDHLIKTTSDVDDAHGAEGNDPVDSYRFSLSAYSLPQSPLTIADPTSVNAGLPSPITGSRHSRAYSQKAGGRHDSPTRQPPLLAATARSPQSQIISPQAASVSPPSNSLSPPFSNVSATESGGNGISFSDMEDELRELAERAEQNLQRAQTPK